MTLYNYSKLADGTNVVEWIVIFNDMSNGVVFTGVAIAFALLIFGLMKIQNVENDMAIIGASFLGFLVTGLMWLIEFEGSRLVPTIVPFVLLITTGIGVFMKMLRDWI
jgi:hypothetical protein